jgi:hypothetical protein
MQRNDKRKGDPQLDPSAEADTQLGRYPFVRSRNRIRRILIGRLVMIGVLV